jgi:hypothetical protein
MDVVTGAVQVDDAPDHVAYGYSEQVHVVASFGTGYEHMDEPNRAQRPFPP